MDKFLNTDYRINVYMYKFMNPDSIKNISFHIMQPR